MALVTGEVQAKSNKFGKFSILVNDTWYSSKFEISCNKGDTVEFDDGDAKYCRKLRVVGGSAPATTGGGAAASNSGGGFPVGIRSKDRSIIRQNSLARACDALACLKDVPDEPAELIPFIIDIAREFEAYSTGDSDMKEVETKLKGFDPEE